MAKIGNLTFEISANIIGLQEDMSRANNIVKKSVEQINTALGTIEKSASLIGVTDLINKFEGIYDATIKDTTSLNDLSGIAAATGENLSQLTLVSKLTGTSMDSMAESALRLNETLALKGGENNDATLALKALGVASKDSSDELESSIDILIDMGKSMSNFKDDADKAGNASILFSKSASESLKILKEIGKQPPFPTSLTKEQIGTADTYKDSDNTFTSTKQKSNSEAAIKGTRLGTDEMDTGQTRSISTLKDVQSPTLNYDINKKKMSEDFDLTLRMLKKYGYLHNLSESLLYYRLHDKQVTHNGGEGGSSYWNEIRNKIVNDLINN